MLVGTGAFVVGGGVSLWVGVPAVVALMPAALAAWGSSYCCRTRVKPIAEKFNKILTAIHKSSQTEKCISEIFDPLSIDQKIEILTYVVPGDDDGPRTNLAALLLGSSIKNKWILKSLFKDLSSEQRIEVISQCFQKDIFLSAWLDSEVLEILFEKVTRDDKYRFLKTSKDNLFIFMHIIKNTHCLMMSSEEHRLRFFLKDLSDFQYDCLFTDKYNMTFTITTSPQVVTVLDLAVNSQADSLINLLMEYGALKSVLRADPNYDFCKLVSRPAVNKMLFRASVNPRRTTDPKNFKDQTDSKLKQRSTTYSR